MRRTPLTHATLSRRALLASGVALGAATLTSTTSARAIGPRSEVGIGMLKHGANWSTRPEALRRLLWEAGKRTSISVARESTTVGVDDAELFWQPFLVLTGEGAMPAFDAKVRARLEQHLRFGGML